MKIQDDLSVPVEEADIPTLIRVGDLAAYVEERIPSSTAAA